MAGKDNIQEKILEHLMSSGFSSGATIREVDLAGIFGVGITPVREALNNLEAKGFVERRKRKGTYLKPFSLKELWELYDLRSVLEGLAVRLMCGAAAPGAIKELRLLAEEYEEKKPGKKRSVLSQLDYEFHSKIVEYCGNERLKVQVKESHAITKFFYVDGSEYVAEIALKNPYTHLRIVSAVEKTDGIHAEKLMRRHVEWAKENTVKRMIAEGADSLQDAVQHGRG